jgi:hypothetical protein
MDAEHWIVVAATLLVVIVCVHFHYEGLRLFVRIMRKNLLPTRLRIVALIFGELLLHAVEIWLFALVYVLLLGMGDFGYLVNAIHLEQSHLGLADLMYYSATVYTTLGFGDFAPQGAIRFLTGSEAVAGLLLITWSASFIFIEMQRHWEQDL